ncbi:hypothetical protein DL768_000264 [Monosporascus sp. mg162]|nr:hypothetical protein DL768_000264 [Monosporascus sp. mg162]
MPDAANAKPVEFVWPDISCIDQRKGHPHSAAEIGRQSNHPHKGLTNANPMTTRVAPATTADHLVRIHACFQILLADPWYSSTWTLEEAYLRPDAVLFSREGNAIENKDLGGYHHIPFDITGYCEEYFGRGEHDIPEPYPKSGSYSRIAASKPSRASTP